MTKPTPARIPEAIWSGAFRILGVEIKCHTLDDGQRIIEAESMEQLMDAMGASQTIDSKDIEAFAQWRAGETQ